VVKPTSRQPNNRRKSTWDAFKGCRTPKTSMMTRHSTPEDDRPESSDPVPGGDSEPGRGCKLQVQPSPPEDLCSDKSAPGSVQVPGSLSEPGQSWKSQARGRRPPREIKPKAKPKLQNETESRVQGPVLEKAAREESGAEGVFDFKPRVEQGRSLTFHELGAILAQLAHSLNGRLDAVRAIGDRDLRPTCPGVREPEGDLREVQGARSTQEEEQENVGSSEHQYWDRGRFEERDTSAS
jgi:hypothetical protein